MTWEKRLQGAAGGVALLILAGAVGVLSLQALGIHDARLQAALQDAAPSISPGTALGFVLASAALFASRRPSHRSRRAADALALASMFTILLGLLGPKFGVTRPAYNTMSAFLLQGAALLLLDRRPRAAQRCTLLAAILALFALAGYVYGAPSLYRAVEETWGMARLTALLHLGLTLGILCARPCVGFMVILSADDTAGRTMRRLLPALLSIPLMALLLKTLATGESLALPTAAAVLAVLGFIGGAQILFAVGRMLKRQERLQVRLNDVIVNCSDPIIDTNPEGIVLSWNRAAERMYGHSAADIMGRNILDVVPEGDRRALAAIRMQILKSGHSAVYDGWRVRKDGGRIFASTTLSPVRDTEGQIVGISAITRDTTVNHAIRTVDEATQKISAVLADLPSGDVPSVLSVIVECARKLTGAEFAAVGLGVAPDAAFGTWVDDNGGPPPRPAHVAEDRPDLKGAEAIPLSFRGTHVGTLYVRSKERFSEVEHLVLRLLAERASAAVEIAAAYTRQASERARLHCVIDQMPEPVVLLDERGHMKHLNRAALAITGSSPCGRDDDLWLDLRRPGGAPLAFQERPVVRALRDSEEMHGVEFVVHTVDGRDVPYLVNAAPVRDEGGIIGAVEVLQDISALKELERLREEWTALVAHDLRQPVTMIRLSAQSLARTFADVERARAPLERIHRAATQLDSMIQDLLDVAQIEAHRLTIHAQQVELTGLVTDIVRDMADATAPHPVELRIEDGPLPVEVDSSRITQVLGNLLTNAAKYSTPGSEIVVDVKRVGRESHVAVQNRGRGIPAAELPALFERFYRSKASRESGIPGLGLGLPITRGIVEAHGGRIWVESIPNEVTTFHFALPLLADVDRAA